QPSQPSLRATRMAPAAHAAASTSSSMMPQPPGSLRSAARAGHGFSWSARRNSTKPTTVPSHELGAAAHVKRTPATSSMQTISGRRDDGRDLRVVQIRDGAVDGAADLALRIDEDLHGERGIFADARGGEPIVALVTLAQPERRADARLGLRRQELLELALVVV